MDAERRCVALVYPRRSHQVVTTYSGCVREGVDRRVAASFPREIYVREQGIGGDEADSSESALLSEAASNSTKPYTTAWACPVLPPSYLSLCFVSRGRLWHRYSSTSTRPPAHTLYPSLSLLPLNKTFFKNCSRCSLSLGPYVRFRNENTPNCFSLLLRD